MNIHMKEMLIVLVVFLAAISTLAQEPPQDDPLQALLQNREAMVRTTAEFDTMVLRMQETLARYTNQIQVLQAEIDRQQEVLEKLNKARSEEAEKKIEYAEKLKRLQQLFTEQRDELEQSKVRIYELQKTLDGREIALKEAEFVQGSIEELQTALEEQRALNSSLRERIGALEVQVAEEQAKRAEAEAVKTSELNRAPTEAALRKRIATLEQQLIQLREQRQQEAWEKTILQESLTQLRVDMESEIAPPETEDERPAMARMYEAVPRDTAPPSPGAEQAPVIREEPVVQDEPEPAPVPAVPPAEMVQLANKKLRAGQVRDAQSLFESALAVEPKLSGARLGLASCYYAQRNFASSKELIDGLLYDEPRNAHALGLRGLIAYNESDMETAAEALDLALQINGTDPQLHNYYGMVLYAQGNVDQAAEEFRASIELDSSRPEAQMNLALLLAGTEPADLEEARRYYEQALELGGASNKRLEALLYE